MALAQDKWTGLFSLDVIFNTLFSQPAIIHGKSSVTVENKLSAVERLFSAVKIWQVPAIKVVSKKAVAAISNNIEGFSENHDTKNRLSKIISAAIDMASEEVDHAYHSNFHYLVEVPIMTSLLGYEALQAGEIKKEDMAYMMIAAFIHDYAHDGGVNGEKQFRLEQQSLDAAKEQLSAAGLTKEEFENIITPMVLATDVSGDNPANSLKAFARTGDPNTLKFDERIKEIFVNNAKLVQMALMLHEGDIGASAALSQEYGRSRTEDVKKETGDKKISFTGFLEFVVGEDGFVSRIGEKMLKSSFDAIKDRSQTKRALKEMTAEIKQI